MKTYLPNSQEFVRKWHVVDAKDAVLGRLAVKIANALRGKDKPTFTPHIDAGTFVVVVNAAKVKLTGKKEDQKSYMSYSGWRGGERYRALKDVRAQNPTFIIEHAVKGMLPKNRLGRQMLKKLKIYAGAEHPHVAQQPQPMAAN